MCNALVRNRLQCSSSSSSPSTILVTCQSKANTSFIPKCNTLSWDKRPPGLFLISTLHYNARCMLYHWCQRWCLEKPTNHSTARPSGSTKCVYADLRQFVAQPVPNNPILHEHSRGRLLPRTMQWLDHLYTNFPSQVKASWQQRSQYNELRNADQEHSRGKQCFQNT